MFFSMAFITGNRNNMYKSAEAIDWVLLNGAATFPGIETMRLGVLQFPAPVDTELSAVHQAAHLMNSRVHHLLANALTLKCLSVDQARAQDEGLLDDAIRSGELGNSLEEVITITTGVSWCSRWKREVRFNISTEVARRVRARFEYTRM